MLEKNKLSELERLKVGNHIPALLLGNVEKMRINENNEEIISLWGFVGSEGAINEYIIPKSIVKYNGNLIYSSAFIMGNYYAPDSEGHEERLNLMPMQN